MLFDHWGFSFQDSGHYVCVTSITDKTSTLAKLTYDHNIHEKGEIVTFPL